MGHSTESLEYSIQIKPITSKLQQNTKQWVLSRKTKTMLENPKRVSFTTYNNLKTN